MSHERFENEIYSHSEDSTKGCGELLMMNVENVENPPVRHLVSVRLIRWRRLRVKVAVQVFAVVLEERVR